MTKTLTYGFATVIVAAILVALSYNSSLSSASAPSGLPATVATSTSPTVTTTQKLVFATSSACAARIITSRTAPLMITFSDVQGKTPTGVIGHQQAASTTVAYDSGLYGCGAVRIYAYASSVITVTETR